MRQLLISALLLVVALPYATAQEVDITSNDGSTIYINKSGDNVRSNGKGGISLQINGMRFNIGSRDTEEVDTTKYYIAFHDGSQLQISEQQVNSLSDEARKCVIYGNDTTQPTRNRREERVQFGFLGLDAPRHNHFAALEIGSNIFTHTDYSAYSPEEAAQLAFTNSKSIYMAFNCVTMNVALNRSRSLAFSMAVGFTSENFTFAGKYTMENRDGMMHAVALDPSTKKSKIMTTSLHIPLTFDWNIDRNWFISAGASIDILLASSMVYKKPRTTIEGIATLNPIQVGVTARIGWRRLYGFINYSPMEMFKPGTGPEIHRMSVGAGIWF